MRAKNFLTPFALSLLLGAPLAAPRADASVSVSVSFFHSSLAPYGEWVTVGNYGRCWRPHRVAAGWQPYLYGEWVWTDAGWTWVSNDPWGGYPYHYGTWVTSADYGWVWIPGTVWAPAWVTWYVSPGYCGWAPVPPSLSVGITGYAGPAVTVARSSYVFVPTSSFAGVDARTARVPVAQNVALAARAQPVTRFGASRGILTAGGPSLANVEHARGSSVPREGFARVKADPVPVAATAHGRAAVVAPAAERARVPASHPEQAARNVSPPHAAAPAQNVHERHAPQPAVHKAPPPPAPVEHKSHAPQPVAHQPAPALTQPAARKAPPPHAEPAVRKAPQQHVVQAQHVQPQHVQAQHVQAQHATQHAPAPVKNVSPPHAPPAQHQAPPPQKPKGNPNEHEKPQGHPEG